MLCKKYTVHLRSIIRGARKASPVGKSSSFREPGGTQIRVGTSTNASDALDSGKLVTAFYDAAAALDEKGVSGDGRVAILNPRQYYAMIQEAGTNGLINRDVQGDALQKGNGVVEVAGIKIYKSMNMPFFGSYGTKYGTGSATNPGTTDPGNTGDFVSEAMEDGRNSVAGVENEYGQASNFNTCGIVFQREAVGMVKLLVLKFRLPVATSYDLPG